jgi:hypothetical protein
MYEFAVLLWIVVIGSSFWVLFDALAICDRHDISRGVAWSRFLACLLIWIIGFPYYLATRNDMHRAKQQELGWVSWAVLGGLLVVLVIIFRVTCAQ